MYEKKDVLKQYRKPQENVLVLLYPDEIIAPKEGSIIVFRSKIDGFRYYKKSNNSIVKLVDEGNGETFNIYDRTITTILNATSENFLIFPIDNGISIKFFEKYKLPEVVVKTPRNRIPIIGGGGGFSGFSGQSGYSGFSGQSGYSGFSGQSGYSGFSGQSGYSGFSGQSGYSGFSGSPNTFASPAFLRETMVDADKTFSANKTQVALITALTAPRTLTLPAANSFAAGTVIQFVDEIGGVTSTNKVAVTKAGADTINNLSTPFTLYTTNVIFQLETDGVSKWTGGIITTPSDGTYTNWSPTHTGFSADPGTPNCRYFVIGKMCHVEVSFGSAGTSNATTWTMTLPFASARVCRSVLGLTLDNGAAISPPGVINIPASGNIATLYKTAALGAWTASGGKYAWFTFSYEIA